MGIRLIAHTLLILSIIIFGIVMAEVYGSQVEAHDRQKNRTDVDTVKHPEIQIDGQVESLRFEHRLNVNDTATVTVRNLGNYPINIEDIIINNKTHAYTIEGYIFDREGGFYFGNTIPEGGFAILKTETQPEDLKPTNNHYNITMKTNIGPLQEIFQATSKIYPQPSPLEPFTPYLLTLLIGSVVTTFYYKRFKSLS
jgi:hypothetical protein